MPAPAEVQAATLDAFLTAWKQGNADDTMALWSDDFEQRLLPTSLSVPPNSRAQAAFFYPKLVGSLTNWRLEIKQTVHDPARGTAAVYATSEAETPIPEEKWKNEFSIFITFTDDGLRVSRLNEMVDSAFYKGLFPKMQSYMMQQGVQH